MAISRPQQGYSQFPQMQVPERWPLATAIQNRNEDANKDARIINGIVEKDVMTGDFWVQKRPGHNDGSVVEVASGNGVYNWNNNLYSIFGLNIYKDAALLSGLGPLNAGVHKFVDMNFASPDPLLVFGNGAAAFYTDGTTVTQITDPDFPSSFCKGWAYLDGYLFVMDRDCNIYNSDIEDPSAWDPLNVIKARNEPSYGVALAKQGPYVVALKARSTEFFYNAGNLTGSPLKRVTGASFDHGCADDNSVVQSIEDLIWVTDNNLRSPQVIMLRGTKYRIVSTPQIDRILRSAIGSTILAFSLMLGGHRYYIINSEFIPFSLVYDITQDQWYFWSNNANSARWPFNDSSYVGGNIIIQSTSNGFLYACDSDYIYPTDGGVPAPVHIFTPNVDLGVDRRKTLTELSFNGDQVTGSELLVNFSDDDYQTFSNQRIVDLSLRKPSLTNEGSFYRRAYHLQHQKPTPFRIKTMGLQLDIGTK
jgi:hypothetical protein